MSEPLGTDDLEDVVSSVRRLVSPEARPRPVSRDLGQDKLLLTSAFRVTSEPEAPAAPQSAASVPADQTAEAVHSVLRLHPVPEADASDPVAVAMPDEDAPVPVETEPPSIAALQMADSEWEDAFWSEPEPTLSELALGAEEAELVPPPEAPEPADPAASPEQDDDAWAKDEPVPFIPFHRSGAHANISAPPSAQPAGLESAAVAMSADAVGTDETDMPPMPEAVSTGRLTLGDVAQAAEPEAEGPKPADPSEASITADSPGLAASAMTQVLTDPDGNPVTVLDEEALSQIVRLLIREELQGALGERITHNVRKLVRAEINRALASQSLE